MSVQPVFDVEGEANLVIIVREALQVLLNSSVVEGSIAQIDPKFGTPTYITESTTTNYSIGFIQNGKGNN